MPYIRSEVRVATSAVALIVSSAFLTIMGRPAAQAQQVVNQDLPLSNGSYSRVSMPLVIGWYDGKPALYLSTETSNRQLARMTHTTYSPVLEKAIAGGAVDDIYTVTNFNQGNVIPLAPSPEGPMNRKIEYTPLWQLSLVTWKSGARAHVLRSEAQILAENASGNVTISKTNIVINCPIIYTDKGGLFPGAKLEH